VSWDVLELHREILEEFTGAEPGDFRGAVDLGQGGFSVRRVGGDGACYWCGGELAPTSAWCCAAHLSYKNDYQARRLARALGIKDATLCHRPGCSNLRAPNRLACEGHLVEARERYHRRRAVQEKLPKERAGLTHHFEIYSKMPKTPGEIEDRFEWVDGYLTVNVYPEDDERKRLRGRVGEIFIKVGKEGDEKALLDQWAICFSVALQYGAPFEELCRKFLGTKFEPAGATKHKDIPRCTSVVDYVARFLLLRYGS
jgi:hypothetical protein